MSVQGAYREWRAARDLMLQDDISNFSDEFDDRHRAANRALCMLARAPIETLSEATMALEAALDGIDLPETPRRIVIDALAFLKAQ